MREPRCASQPQTGTLARGSGMAGEPDKGQMASNGAAKDKGWL